LKVINGRPLPHGWLGKNWACHQLAQAATSDVLIFSDADVRWSSDAIASVMRMMEQSQADLLTVWPTQKTKTWSERWVVSLLALAIIGYLPILGVHFVPSAAFAAACGQCLVFRRRAYEAVGGHAGVRDSIIEDVALAKRIKSNGFKLRMADGAGVIGCRMYTSWDAVRNGFAKNILAGHGNSVLFLTISALFHWAIFVVPWLWLALGSGSWGWPVWPLALIALGVGVRALTAAVTRQRVIDAVFMPVSVVLMTVIAAQSVWWHWHGGPQWKGRKLTQHVEPSVEPSMPRKYPVSSHRVGGRG
jgi:chlorobactene glucosyltransferase